MTEPTRKKTGSTPKKKNADVKKTNANAVNKTAARKSTRTGTKKKSSSKSATETPVSTGKTVRKTSGSGAVPRKSASQIAREAEVRRLKTLIAAVSAVVLILGGLLIHHLLAPVDKGSLTGVSDEVLQYEASVKKACKDAGISQFSTVMLAMMQQESSGLGTDVMQCSECPFNTEYDNTPNAIDNPEYSIQVGAEYFAYCLKEAGCKRIRNTERLKIALQDYNFGNSYATWVLENYGSYSVENATEFSLMMQNTLGWSSYGDPEYVDHVLRYYTMP